MIKDENTLKNKIAETLCELAELIIRRSPPFNRIPLQPEVTSSLLIKYYKYYNEIDESLKGEYILAEIALAKYLIQNTLVGVKESFATKYPEHMKAREAFDNWIIQREGPPEPVYIDRTLQIFTEKVKVNQIIKQIFNERKPDFSYDKSAVYPGIIPFSKPWLKDNKVYIIADKGTKRQFLDFHIGIAKPEFFIDIANFFGRAQSWYNYNTVEELIQGINKALDIIDLLLPHFLERIKKVLEF